MGSSGSAEREPLLGAELDEWVCCLCCFPNPRRHRRQTATPRSAGPGQTPRGARVRSVPSLREGSAGRSASETETTPGCSAGSSSPGAAPSAPLQPCRAPLPETGDAAAPAQRVGAGALAPDAGRESGEPPARGEPRWPSPAFPTEQVTKGIADPVPPPHNWAAQSVPALLVPGCVHAPGADRVAAEEAPAPPEVWSETPGEVVLGSIPVIYHTDALLGSGGCGAVFRGTALGAECAVKRNQEKSAEACQLAVAALAEARSFSHGNIIRTIASGWHGGYVWHVMPVASGNLMPLCGMMTFAGACACASKVAAGVAYLHEHGWVHRDLKVSNVLLVDNEPKVSDLDGMRRQGTVSPSTTLTWLYASPEVAVNQGGNPITEDTPRDVWALGVLCYEVLLRRVPAPLANSQRETVAGSKRGRALLEKIAQRSPTMPPDERVEVVFYVLAATARLTPKIGVDEVGHNVKQILDECFHKAPGSRCSAAQVRDGFAAIAAAHPHELPRGRPAAEAESTPPG